MDLYHPTALACRSQLAAVLLLGLFLLVDATWHPASAEQTPPSAEAPSAASAAPNPQAAGATLNTDDCLATLNNVRDKLEAVGRDVVDLKTKLETTSKDIDTLREQYSKQAATLDDELTRLRQRNAELEARADRPPAQHPTGSLGDSRAWIVGSLAFLAGTLLTTLLRQQRPEVTAGKKRKPAFEKPLAFTKRIDLALRSPAADWPEFRALVDTDWRDLPNGVAWSEDWAEVARRAMQRALHSADQPAGRHAAADFAGNVWARFASQFEPDRNSWTWTDEQCRRALPEELRIELGTVRPNEPYNQHASVITQASGEGQFVADVHFPGCRVRGTDGRTLHESGAVVVKGDRL